MKGFDSDTLFLLFFHPPDDEDYDIKSRPGFGLCQVRSCGVCAESAHEMHDHRFAQYNTDVYVER